MTAIVDVSFEERYWYPEDGGVVWLTGFQLIDVASGSFIGRDDPQLAERGLRVAGVAGAARHHSEALASSELTSGSVLELRRDPGNEHDPNAIAVHAPGDGGQVGWVPRELAGEIAPEMDAGRPWSAVVLREQRASPRDPRTGLTMLLAADGEIELREVSPDAGRGAGRPRSGAGRTSPRRPGPPR
jgi:HIRAN domain